MKEMKIIISELDNANQLNNEEFVTICSLFFQKLQYVDEKIANKILDHETNKIIINKLHYISKLNGN